jgi:CDP-diacylglycerol--serine O-phosphatidyltransferase
MRIPRVSILASLCTLGNALCGFGAITLTTKALLASETHYDIYRHEIVWAGYLVILAMAFDTLDGRLARFARATSDFGGQLDSLADAVSFGVAPAFLMNRVVVEALHNPPAVGPEKMLWIAWAFAAVYLGCALIRLARFNVENIHDEEAHLSFKGLPSPAAAGALVSLIIVVMECCDLAEPSLSTSVILWILPFVALALGLLMVSNVRYTHLVNQFVRGRRPVGHLVLILLAIALAFLLREILIPVGFCAYVLSGPAWSVWRRLSGRRAPPVAPPPKAGP